MERTSPPGVISSHRQKYNRLPSCLVGVIIFAMVSSCGPREPVQFRSVRNVVVDTNLAGEPMLHGEAIFYNPNAVRMKLKEINVEVWVDGKKSAQVDQHPNQVIPGSSEFSVMVEARLSLQDMGLLNTVLNLLGGRKYKIELIGFVRIRVHGITVKVPIRYADEVRLKI